VQTSNILPDKTETLSNSAILAAMKSLGHEHIIEPIRPAELSPAELLRRTEQIGVLMMNVQRFYTDELGLVRIDLDAPPASHEDTVWRIPRLAASKGLCIAGREFTIAHRLEPGRAGAPAERSSVLDGICGMALLTKETGCTATTHTKTELYEFDVVKEDRGAGLGKLLLSKALEAVHPQDELYLNVAEANEYAMDYYSKLGFGFTGEEIANSLFEYPDGSTAYHVAMTAPAHVVQENLAT